MAKLCNCKRNQAVPAIVATVAVATWSDSGSKSQSLVEVALASAYIIDLIDDCAAQDGKCGKLTHSPKDKGHACRLLRDKLLHLLCPMAQWEEQLQGFAFPLH